jgi:alpha-L-fucosidase 2
MQPAARFDDLKNVEAPELYGIFPYGLHTVAAGDLALGRATFAARRHPDAEQGWQQHAIQAASLGLADEAAARVVQRFAAPNPRMRFPAFWGINYDWLPDLDHGSVAMIALQRMLLQWDGDRLLVLPAWPHDWEVDFSLPGPDGIQVSGQVAGGRLTRLDVRGDRGRVRVEICDPWKRPE